MTSTRRTCRTKTCRGSSSNSMATAKLPIPFRETVASERTVRDSRAARARASLAGARVDVSRSAQPRRAARSRSERGRRRCWRRTRARLAAEAGSRVFVAAERYGAIHGACATESICRDSRDLRLSPSDRAQVLVHRLPRRVGVLQRNESPSATDFVARLHPSPPLRRRKSQPARPLPKPLPSGTHSMGLCECMFKASRIQTPLFISG